MRLGKAIIFGICVIHHIGLLTWQRENGSNKFSSLPKFAKSSNHQKPSANYRPCNALQRRQRSFPWGPSLFCRLGKVIFNILAVCRSIRIFLLHSPRVFGPNVSCTTTIRFLFVWRIFLFFFCSSPIIAQWSGRLDCCFGEEISFGSTVKA
ncbi:hypothetical protein DFS34DRAFT_102945 [Phlyctochytrium arcticum]|nr:hypothetical protein DFS34DRAFT_102945 [Phlyctochytrium arcticum]